MKTYFAILTIVSMLSGIVNVNASSSEDLLLPADKFIPSNLAITEDTINPECSISHTDTSFHYNGRTVVVNEQNDEINVSVYRLNVFGDTVKSNKIYEGIFTENRTVERRYDNSFEIFVPDIFKSKDKRKLASYHWAGFGIGFSNLPVGLSSDGEMSSVLNKSRSLQYNLNFTDTHWKLGKSGLSLVTGMGIQFNAMHLQTNKYVEVIDYKTVISSTDEDLKRSRLHYTYLTFPVLLEMNFPIGYGETVFLNGGIVAKIKTASSSKIWFSENGKDRKEKLSGDLNIRPITYDFLLQAGVGDLGFFASYSPLNLYLDNKGPEANQGTVGIQFYF